MTSLPNRSLSRAVLIGVGDYRRLSGLPAVHRNLIALREVLCADRFWGLPSNHCALVDGPETAAEMLDPVVEAAHEATDTLLLYYAGHGLVDRRSDLHLALVGSDPDPKRMYTSVPYVHVRDALLDSRASRRIVILDCCYSGRALGQMSNPVSGVVDEASAEGTYVLAAAAENRAALAPTGQDFTAFTGEFLNIVYNGISTCGPLLDLDSIYRYLLAAMKAKGFPTPQKRDRNTAGQLALIRNQAFGLRMQTRDARTATQTSAGGRSRVSGDRVPHAAIPGLPVAIGPSRLSYSAPFQEPASKPVHDASSQQAFIGEIAPVAIAAQRKYGVPASVTIAQAIDESDWGKSMLTTKDHNLFGIKGMGPAGTDSLPSREYQNGHLMTRIIPFRVYNNTSESIDDHCKILATSGYYCESMATRRNPNAFAESLTGIYATDPSYGTRLISLMRRYDLYRYDVASPVGKPTPTIPTTSIPGLPVARRPSRLSYSAPSPDGPSPAESPFGGSASFDRVGRNDPCPCGSGRKYKRCHGDPRNI